MQMHSMLRNSIAHSPDALFLVDERQRIVAWNEALERLLGIAARDAVGRSCGEVLGGRDCQGRTVCSAYCPVAQLRDRSESILPFELLVRRGDGTPLQVRCTVLSLSLDTHDTPGLLYHLHVTGRPEQPAPPPPPAPAPDERLLSRREREVLALLAEGAGVSDIASRLGITATTARNHIQRLLQKLGAHSRLEAVVVAQRRRLL